MKSTNYLLSFVCVLTMNLLSAQEVKEAKDTKMNIIAFGGIGYGIIVNDKQPNYNMNSNNGELLFNYKFHKIYGIATGIGLNELSGSGFNSNGNFYHERTIIKIPLLATMNYAVSDKFNIVGGLGFYTQNIINDEYRFLNNTQSDVYEGWNFGAQLNFGFVIKTSENFSIGVNYSGQSDFSEFETNSNQGFNDKQKLKNLNSMGLVFVIDL